jgi:hypothetical protein
MANWEGYRRKGSLPILRYSSHITQNILSKPKKTQGRINDFLLWISAWNFPNMESSLSCAVYLEFTVTGFYTVTSSSYVVSLMSRAQTPVLHQLHSGSLNSCRVNRVTVPLYTRSFHKVLYTELKGSSNCPHASFPKHLGTEFVEILYWDLGF